MNHKSSLIISENLRETTSTILSILPAVRHSAQHNNYDAAGIDILLRCAYENLRMAQNLSAYFELEEYTPAKAPFCVTSALQDFVISARQICKTAVIDFNFSAHAWVNANERLFFVCIGNLLSNSLIYAAENPHIKIRVYTTKNNIIIKIHDNSKGIRPTVVHKVFKPFVSLDPYDEHAPKPGLGLGLTIAKKYMHVYGGRLITESRFGIGSTMTLLLPTCEQNNEHTLNNFLCDRYSTLYTQLCSVCTLPT